MKTALNLMNSHPIGGVLVVLLAILAVLALAPAMAAAGHGLKDVGLKVTKALKSAAGAVTSGSIDTGTNSTGSQVGSSDWLLSAPATGTNLGDAHTVTYAIIMSASSDLSGPTTLYPSVIIQTGASSAGAAATTFRFRIPSTALRYIGFTATNGSAEDLSAASATLELLT